ncbi:MAG: prepilin-type N-terminal cleavage/methylation domain-containing protein [Nitrosomonadales bacterium]|nr:prepilin-type N-terminal cleavage/methylation domain-containing protein [Nitrosomonadales bacterium]
MGYVTHRKENFTLLPSPFPLPRRGFTLIELLVVLVIMSIALGMAVVQLMPDSRTALREEAQRLALLLENAGMEARVSGQPMAWSFENSSYRFWKKNSYGDWMRMEDDAMFRPRALPDGITIAEASVEAQPLKAGERMSLGAASFALPFRLRLNGGAAVARIAGSSTGAVSAQLDSE